MKDEAHGEEDDAVIGAFDPTLQLLRAKKNFLHSCKVNGCSETIHSCFVDDPRN